MKKKNLIALSAGLLGCAALVGVGFSAWIITNGDKVEDTGNVTVKVGDVDDQRFTLVVEMIDSVVNFDGATSDNSGQIYWSGGIASSDNYGEDLTFSFKVAISATSSSAALGDILGDSESGKAIRAYLTAKNSDGNLVSDFQNAIVLPLGTSEESSSTLFTGNGTYTDETSADETSSVDTASQAGYTVKWSAAGQLTVTCTFGWGSLTNYTNPGSYDGNSSSVSVAESALSIISQLSSYTWTVTVFVAA